MKKEDTDPESILRNQSPGAFEVQASSLVLEERLRHLKGEARPVTAEATDAAPVLHVAKGEQGFFDDFVRRFPLPSGDSTDTAGIVTDVVGVQKVTGADDRTSVEHWPASFGGSEHFGGRQTVHY